MHLDENMKDIIKQPPTLVTKSKRREKIRKRRWILFNALFLINVCVCIHTHTHTHMSANVYISTSLTCIHTTFICIYTKTYVYIYLSICIHTFTHTHTYTHSHVHTSSSLSVSLTPSLSPSLYASYIHTSLRDSPPALLTAHSTQCTANVSCLQCNTLQHPATHCNTLQPTYYPQKSHIINGSFAKNDLQLQAFYGSSPPRSISTRTTYYLAKINRMPQAAGHSRKRAMNYMALLRYNLIFCCVAVSRTSASMLIRYFARHRCFAWWHATYLERICCVAWAFFAFLCCNSPHYTVSHCSTLRYWTAISAKEPCT